jgi:hypothetical protein
VLVRPRQLQSTLIARHRITSRCFAATAGDVRTLQTIACAVRSHRKVWNDRQRLTTSREAK